MQSGQRMSEEDRREQLRQFRAKRKREMQATLVNKPVDRVPDPYSGACSAVNLIRKGTGFISGREMLKHKCTWDSQYPEKPDRLASVLTRLSTLRLVERCVTIPHHVHEDILEEVKLMHTEEHYNELKRIQDIGDLDGMEKEAQKYDAIYFNDNTFDCARMALECTINLVRAVADGTVHNGMAVVRPPGHHAMGKEFCGYCYFNNVAIAADVCIKQGLAKKILIVDYDVHHGQGTQQHFYERDDVLYFSIHRYEHGKFWPNLFESCWNFIGKGTGLGYNINVPLNETGLGDDDYLAIIWNILLPVAYEFNPDLIIVSAGYDAAMGCPEGQMKVTPAFYAHLITMLGGLAEGKIAVVLEGGYFLPSLAEGVAMTLKALLGDQCPILDRVKSTSPLVIEVVNNIRSILHDTWKCFSIWPKMQLPTAAAGPMDNARMKIKYFGTPDQPPFSTRDCYPVPTEYDKQSNESQIQCLQLRYDLPISREVCYCYHEDMLDHKPNAGDVERPEKPERLQMIMEMFSVFRLDNRCVRLPVNEREFDTYGTHHDDYIKRLSALQLDQSTDVYHNNATFKAVKKATAGLLTVIDNVMTNNHPSGVAVIRPPGHHAEYDKAMGYCFVNNIAIAASYIMQTFQTKRILIVDFDIHHGNGTQNLFYCTNEVMYISVHRFDEGRFFPNMESANYCYDGFGAGQGFNINIPLSTDKMGDLEYLAIFQTIILPIAYSYAPEVILVSAGFDAGINDPLGGGYHVAPQTFGQFIQLLKPLAQGRLIVSLEGGYNLHTTAYGMTMCTKTLLGDPLPKPENINREISKSACRTILQVSTHFAKYWPILNCNKALPCTPVLCHPRPGSTERVLTDEMYKPLDVHLYKNSDYVETEFRNLLAHYPSCSPSEGALM